MSTNRYLSGNYSPVTEELDARDLEVTGELPAELDGRYLRNGPNPLDPDPSTYHWFRGEGMVHGVRLRDGHAEWYRNRIVRTGHAAEVLGVPDPGGPVTAGMEGAAPNTNVIGLDGRTFAIVEAGTKPVELTDDLETVGRVDFDGGLPNGYTAHPKVDPATGELHASSYYWANPQVIEYTVVAPDATVQRYVPVAVPGNPMVHDMSITASKAVFYDLPCTFDLERAMSDLWPYVWDEDYGARVGVMSRTTGEDDVQWFEVEPCYVFHPLNAHDDGDRVVLDVVRHPRMFASDLLGPNEGATSLWRWTLDTATGTVKEEQLDDQPVEFPRVDERVVGRPHRFGWMSGLSLGEDGVGYDGSRLIRYDLATGEQIEHDFGPGRATGEAVFVPRAADAAEDDGWVMSLVYDAAADRSELVLLDAADPAAAPVASVHLPQRVPFGFHGNWVPAH